MASAAIQSLLLEHAVAKGYTRVLTDYPESLKKSLGNSSVTLALHLRMVCHSLERIARSADRKNYDFAVSLITSLLDLDHQVVSSSLLTKALLSLQVSVLFDMLQKDDKNVLAKLNTFCPASGFSHPNVEEKLEMKLTNAQKNFRKFFVPLVADRAKRAAYMSGDYHTEFGEGLLLKSVDLLQQCCEKLKKAMPPTGLERLMQSQKQGKLLRKTAINGNILFKTLLHEIDEDSITEEKVLNLLKKLTNQSSKTKNQAVAAHDDTTSEETSFEESPVQMARHNSEKSQKQTEEKSGNEDESEEEKRPRRTGRRTCAPKKYAESSSEETEDESEESEEESEEDLEEEEKQKDIENKKSDITEEVITLSSTEDTDESSERQTKRPVKRVFTKQSDGRNKKGINEKDISSDLSAFQSEKKSNRPKTLRHQKQVDDFDSTASEAEEKVTKGKKTKKDKTGKGLVNKESKVPVVKTPKSTKKAASGVRSEEGSKGEGTPVSTKKTPKSAKKTPKSAKNTPKIAMKTTTEKAIEDQVEPKTPKSAKKMPKIALMSKTPGSAKKGSTPKSVKKATGTPKSNRRVSLKLKEKDVLEDLPSEENMEKPTDVEQSGLDEAESSGKSSGTPRRTLKRRSESVSNTDSSDTTDNEKADKTKGAMFIKSPSPAKIARLRSASKVASSSSRRRSRNVSSSGINVSVGAESTTPILRLDGHTPRGQSGATPKGQTPKTQMDKHTPVTRSGAAMLPLEPEVIVKHARSPACPKQPQTVVTKLQQSARELGKSPKTPVDNPETSSSDESDVIPVYTPKSGTPVLTRVTRNSPMPDPARGSKPKRSMPGSVESSVLAKRKAAGPDMLPSQKPTGSNAGNDDDSDESWQTCSEPDSSMDDSRAMSEETKKSTKSKAATEQTGNARRRSARNSSVSMLSSESSSSDAGETQVEDPLPEEKGMRRKSSVGPNSKEKSGDGLQRHTRRSSGMIVPSSKSSGKDSEKKERRKSSKQLSSVSSSDSDIEEVQTVSIVKLKRLSRGKVSPLPDLKKHLKSPLVKPCVVLLTKEMEVSTGSKKKTIIRF